MDRRQLLLLALVAMCLAVMPARAQLGEQPIRIIFPFAPGGSGDVIARLMADRLNAGLNRPVIVENRTGAAGRLGTMAVKNAPPDGNTLLFTPIAPVAIYQHVYPALGYDPIVDFKPVVQIGTFEFGLAVATRVPVRSVKELADWLKANPSEASYGSPAAGTLPHFLGVMFGRAIGIDLSHVSYRGSAAALADLIAGQIPMMFTTTTDLVEMHRAGRIRVLATSDRQRSSFLPDLPTFEEAGYDLEATGWYGLFAPGKTPTVIVERIGKVLADAIATPEIKSRLLTLGLAPSGVGPAEFAAIQKADSEKWAPAVKASGFTPEQ